MSTSVGSIYSSIVLDDSQFTTSLRNILTTANNSLTSVSALAVKTSNSFTQIGVAAGNSNKTIKDAGNTIAGLKSKLEELQTKLESSQLGSQKFTLLKSKIDSTKQALENAYKSSDVLRGKLTDLGGSSEVTAGKMSGLGSTLASLATGVGFTMLLKNAAQASIAYEKLHISMSVMLGSASKATETLEKFSKFATATPFTDDQVNQAGKALVAFGVSTDEVIEKMTRIGDISAGVGKDFNELALIYGKAKVAGTLYAEDINQLLEAGIPIMGEFAKQLGTTEGQVKKMASEGKLTFEMFDKAMVSMTESGSKFGGMMDKQSQSIGGKLSTIESNLSNLLKTTGDSMMVALSPAVDIIGKITDALSKGAKEAGPFAKTMITVGTGVAGLTVAILALGSGLSALGVTAVTTGSMMTAAFGPVGLAIMAIGAAFVYARNQQAEYENGMKKAAGTGVKNIEVRAGMTGLKADDINKAGANIDALADKIKAFQENGGGSIFTEEGRRKNKENVVGQEQAIKSLRAEMVRLGMTKQEIDKVLANNNGVNANMTGIKELAAGLKNVKEEAGKIESVKINTGGAKQAVENIDAFLNRAVKLDELTKGGLSFNVSIPQDQLDSNKAQLEKWAKDNKVQLDYTSKFDATKNKPFIDVEMKIPENVTGKQREALKAQIQQMKGVIDSNSLKADITPKIDTKPINEIHSKSLAFMQSWKEFGEAKGMAKFAQGVQLGSNALQEMGGQFANLLQAQAQLANVKFTNFKQMNSWMTEGLGKALDTRYKAIEQGFDNELKIVNDEKKALADEEKAFQAQQAADKAAHDKEMQDLEASNLAELKRLKDEYRLSAQTENDLEYQAALQKLTEERDNQIAAMEQETTDEQQRVINRQFIEQSYEESKLQIRDEFDQKLAMKNEANELLLQQKADEQAAAKAAKEKAFNDKQQADAIARDSAKEARELALTQRAEKLELQKANAAKARDLEQQDLQRKSKMFEWVMGRSSFEAAKQAQIASAQIQMATGVLNAVSAGALMAATIPVVGWVLGPVLAATLSGMVLAAGSTSLSAIASTQYPPPPIFESGGLINGASHAMGGEMINAEGGEFIVNKKSTAENLDLLQSINNGGAANRSNHQVVNVGQVQVVVYNPHSTADITNQVSDELMRSLQSRLGRTY